MTIIENGYSPKRYLPLILALTVFVGSLVSFSGCRQNPKNLSKVYGVVRVDGKPLTKGTVMFVPDAGRSATGTIQSDGTFTMQTFGDSDGALVGKHKVAVIAYEADKYNRPAYEAPNQKSEPLVPQHYMSPGTSGLTFEVEAGKANNAEFDLTSH